MKSTSHTIAKNFSVLLSSQLITWTLSLALTILVPRYLGADGIGKLHLATSLWVIMIMIIKFGMDLLLTKEVARSPGRMAELYGSAVTLSIVFFFIGFALLIGSLQWLAFPPATVSVVALVGISGLTGVLAALCQATLQGMERMELFSLGNVLGVLLYSVSVLAALYWGWSIYTIAAMACISTLVNLVLQLYFLRKLYGLQLRATVQTMIYLVRNGFPYLMTGIFRVVYMQLDVVIIAIFVNERTIGWYGAADRLFGTLLFIPTVYLTALYPVFSRLYVTDLTPLKRLASRSFDNLLLLSVPIGLGIFVLADPIVLLLFGPDFAQSGPVLAVMGIVLLLTYQNMLVGRTLISTDQQNRWTVVMALAALASIALDVLLIPWTERIWGNGAIGGALAFVITEGAMLLIGLYLLPQGTLGAKNLWTALRVLGAGLIMVAVVYQLQAQGLWLAIAAGALTYSSCILLFRVIPKEDWLLAQSLFAQLQGRFRRISVSSCAPSRDSVAN